MCIIGHGRIDIILCIYIINPLLFAVLGFFEAGVEMSGRRMKKKKRKKQQRGMGSIAASNLPAPVSPEPTMVSGQTPAARPPATHPIYDEPDIFKEYDQTQSMLFPPDVADFLTEDHPARLISEIIDALDVGQITGAYSHRGQRAFYPRMMLKLWLYGYTVGVRTSRQLARKTETDVAFMFLAAMQRPDFRTLANFRSKHKEAFANIFAQVVHLCLEAGMVLLSHVSIDGVRMKANASKKKSRDAEALQKEIQQIQDEIEKLLTQSQQMDEGEDEKYGSDDRGDGVPEVLKNKRDRRDFLRKRLGELEQMKEKKVNLTDPDATIQKIDGRLKPGYNAQASVDEEHQIIVSCDVTTQANDYGQLEPGLDGIQENVGIYPEQISADSGYHSGPNLEGLEKREVEGFIPDLEESKKAKLSEEERPFHRHEFKYDPVNDCVICPKGKTLIRVKDDWRDRNDRSKGKTKVYQGQECQSCEAFEHCRQNKNAKGRTIRRDEFEELREGLRAKMNTPEGQAVYSKRRSIIEPVFGNLKHNLGYRHFLLRGLDSVKGEFAVMCTAHNLIKLLLHVSDKGGFRLETALYRFRLATN
jgi:transposase